MMEHYETSNQLATKSNDYFKRTSESFGDIWNKWKKCKVNKKKVIDDTKITVEISEIKNVKTNINRKSPKIPKLFHQTQEIVSYANSESETIIGEINLYNTDVIADNKSDVKSCDDMILKDECQFPDGIANLCQSETQLINQGSCITPKKLVKRSRIPQRRKNLSGNPNISQYYPRSVQRLKKPITKLLPEMEIIPVGKMNIDETQNEKIEDKLSVDINKISNHTELLSSPHHQLSKKSSLDSSVLTNSHEFETQLLKVNHFETFKNDLSESSTWNEFETSESDSTSPTQRKILYRQPFRIAHSTTTSSSNLTSKSLPKSVCSEHERYKLIDALSDIICWPLLLLQQEEE
ncbi:hypothetical protein PV328_006262 [Microctonus aethiopoides]|uniref:Uncharacterized protein n=1 Tax=Microctonus aethiopoides TaxID=144406 RepID=A0AA39KTC7_9HYME|nr:hypothetical protein PV328_006262 [Microctonus aethiopoides]